MYIWFRIQIIRGSDLHMSRTKIVDVWNKWILLIDIWFRSIKWLSLKLAKLSCCLYRRYTIADIYISTWKNKKIISLIFYMHGLSNSKQERGLEIYISAKEWRLAFQAVFLDMLLKEAVVHRRSFLSYYSDLIDLIYIPINLWFLIIC